VADPPIIADYTARRRGIRRSISTHWGEAMTGIVVSAVLLIGGAMLILLLAMRS
jgi:hypothetical protein